MKLTCKKCNTVLEIPADVTQAPDVRVVCPGCQTRYRLRPRKTAPTSPPPPAAAPGPGPTATPTHRAVLPQAPAAPAAPPASNQAHSSLTPATPVPGAPVPTAAGTPPSLSKHLPASTPDGHLPMSAPDEKDTVVARRPGAPGTPVFAGGETIAGRYRILRFLAQGGMGEVYEAEDSELRQKVALKTISPRAGDVDPDAVDRFKREIALARTVTHPNVCRIFELGQHQPPAPAGAPPGTPAPPPITFLTMELLEGETLAALLLRRGRLSTAEALPLVQQMAQALAAAHRAEIVHRDFKSENVFLVPVAGGQATGRTAGPPKAPRRVVVTDFGVARGGAGDRFASQVTGAGIVGTPSYMAPEQVEGGAITTAADVYSLGIVIYEMVTGRLPFEGPNPLSTAVKRLREAPPPPHVHVPDLEAWWEKAILRCLERDPAKRFASPDDLVAALEPPVRPARRPPARPGARPAAPSPAPAAPRIAASRTAASRTAASRTVGPTPAMPAGAAAAARPAPRRSFFLGLLLVLVTVASAALYIFNRDRQLDRSRVTPRRSIAVLGFNNLSGLEDAAWMGTALAEMLTTELARGETLRTIPGENVAQARRQLAGDPAAGGPPSSLESADLDRLRALLGCDFVVSGSYVTVGDTAGREIRLDLRLHDAALGNTVASLSRDGRQQELFRLVSELGVELRDHLDVGDAGGDDPLAGLPSDPEAARLYAEALDDLRASRPRAAREQLEEAARRAPENALVYSALSQAWEVEGFGERAAQAAERAFELSSPLPREDRLAVEGRYREATGDWPAAIEVYGKLCEYFPDDLDYGLRLVAAQTAGRDPQSALESIADLRRLPAPISEDPRLDLAEAAAAGLESDFDRQLRAARQAAQRAAAIDAPLLVAQARLTEARAQRILGRPAESQAAADQARELFEGLNHTSGSAEARTALANIDFDRGNFETAGERYRQVIDVYRRLGDQDGTASGLNNLATVLRKRGDLDGAQALYEEAAGIFDATGDELAMSFALNNLGVVLVARDRLTEAATNFERSRGVWEELGNRSGLAYSLNNVAAVQHLSGELEQSRILNEQALEIRRETGEKAGEATSLTNLADVLRDLGEIDQAEESLRLALELTEEIGDRSARAQALYGLGWLRFETGAFEEARAAHGEALEVRRQLDERRGVTDSVIALARLALETGDAAGAEDSSREVILSCQRQDRTSEEARATAVLALALLAGERLEESRVAGDEAERLAESSERPAVRHAAGIAAARTRTAAGELASALRALERIEQASRDAGYLTWALEARIAWAEAAIEAGREGEAREHLRSTATEAGVHGLTRLVEKAGRF